ncbi:MAG: sensor domain-containing diguanylate cyclase [Coriobacteriia bacterium]|nr:sensor domain-containing diguanylate cyclase [Coriobacteriia bacterium]
MDGRLDELRSLVEDNQLWLMRSALDYARRLEYTRYTSTLEEAWRVSIQGLSTSLLVAVREHGWELEIPCEGDLTKDHAASFGMIEAQMHRSRGVTLTLFLGLMKYYCQAYLDLISARVVDEATRSLFTHAVVRFFDRIEIGFCDEWTRTSGSEALHLLEDRNRKMTNEKNKYLTIFDSMHMPVVLFDCKGRVDNANAAAASLFGLSSGSGAAYYSGTGRGDLFVPLAEDAAAFAASPATELAVERTLETKEGTGQFIVSFKRMLDVSGKFTGFTTALTDISPQKQSEAIYRAMSLKDELTGLNNRRGFLVLARQQAALAARFKVWLSVLFLDIDNMKVINDVHGHSAGDQALRDVADVLFSSLRTADIVGRMGGDEFAVLLVGGEDPRLPMRRFRRALVQFNHQEERPYALSVSVGGSSAAASTEECDVEKLLAEADARMYKQKQRRRVGR